MKKIIGIMGPSKATDEQMNNAFELGKYCAEHGYVTLTGGLKAGIMDEALRGAKQQNGLTVGIMPTDDKSKYSEYIDIPIVTTAKSGRNITEVLTSDLLIACGISAGTSSEISLAIKPGKPIVLVGMDDITNNFYRQLIPSNQLNIVNNYQEAIQVIERIFENENQEGGGWEL